MPMFNWLKQQRPCALCGIEPAKFTATCQDCWQRLPWLKADIIRHEQVIQVACRYDYPIDRIIQQFKYEQQLHYQDLLSSCLMAVKLPRVQAIVPMPISQQRLIERGYNQSLVIAQQLSKQLDIPVWQPIQRLHQHSQKGLNRLERLENIEDQFQPTQAVAQMYHRVLIVDDVVTTGSSIYALSQALTQLGCRQIYAVCLADASSAK